MNASSGSWSTQQLAEFVAAIAAVPDELTATRSGVELVAEALDADAVALVDEGSLTHSVGWPVGAAPVDAILAAAAGRGVSSEPLPVPGAGMLPAVVVDVGQGSEVRLLVARRGGTLDAEEKGLLRAMARTLGLSIRNHRALAELRTRQRLVEGLSEIQRSIARRTPLRQVLGAIVALAHEIMGEDQTVMALKDRTDPALLEIVASTGVPSHLRASIEHLPIGQGAAGLAVKEGRLIVANSYQQYQPAIPGMVRAGIVAAMSAPVFEDGDVVGSLTVSSYTPGRHYSEADQALLTTMAQHASLALGDARMLSEMLHQALHDPLTGMPNRVLFADRLTHALQRAERASSEVAVLFIDLDRFKPVNDSLGHAAGDQLLRLVAQRIGSCLRDSDTAARLGGDEFAVLLEDRPAAADAVDVAQRIIEALRNPVVLDGHEVFVGASIGIATGKRGAEDLLRKADVAMYRAKADGRGRHVLYEANMQVEVMDRLELESDLRHAIDRGELELFYQPLVALESYAVTGMEALIRWRHPKRGVLGPAAFLQIAEETGLMVQIGHWVIETACAQLAGWDAAGAASDLKIHVNLSVHELQDAGIQAAVSTSLAASGLDPSRLMLELTETNSIENTEEISRRLVALRGLGVGLAIDDFGTGYASLRYLSSFSVDMLKMARPFVDSLGSGDDARTLARTIVELGANLGLAVVAEGIEAAEQIEHLRALGCRHGQGFYFSAPLPAAEIRPELLAREIPAATLSSN